MGYLLRELIQECVDGGLRRGSVRNGLAYHAPAIRTAGALGKAGKASLQAIDGCTVRVEFGVHPGLALRYVAVKRSQEERVLAAEGRVKAAARKLGRAQQIRKRRPVIPPGPKYVHGTFDGTFHIEAPGAATRQSY
jgi:hypothetical protein